jgi:acetate kinase
MYCYQIQKYLGAYLAVLGYNVDAVVFAGGVGENGSDVRAAILRGFEPIGLKMDTARNAKAVRCNCETDISATDSRIRVLVIPTNEEQVLLEDVMAILDGTYDVHTRFAYSFQKDVPPAATPKPTLRASTR